MVPELCRTESCISLDIHRYKDSLKEGFEKADLVIRHTGAGSCLETLEKRKPCVVFMNNH